MKLSINLTGLGLSVTKQAKDNLSNNNTPTCVGSMFLPVLNESPSLDIEDFFSDKKTVSPENVMNVDLDNVVLPGDKQFIENKVLSKSGYEKLEVYTKEVGTIYSDQVIKCLNCNVFDKCYKLSFLFLESLKLKYNIE